MQAVVDTGATHSILNRHAAIQVDSSSSSRPYTEGPIKVANGASCTPTHYLRAQVGLGPVDVQHEFLVIRDLPVPVILGLDFLVENSVVVDPAGSSLRFHDYPTYTLPLRACEPKAVFLLREDIALPPFSETRAPVDIRGTCPEVFMAEATGDVPEDPRSLLARSLHTSVPTTLLLCNPTSTATLLPKGRLLAVAEEVEGPKANAATVAASEDPLQDVAINPGITAEQRKGLLALLQAHRNAFATTERPLGASTVEVHGIDTGSARPIRTGLRPMPPAGKEVVRSEVEKMLKMGVVKPSKSPWSSAVVLVKKKDGSTRFCVDYRRLNDVTVKDVYPLPRISDQLESLAGARYFSTLDAASGYWQLRVKEEDQCKTAFITPDGLYEYVGMPFGLCNAPATYQRAMHLILAGLAWRNCLVYIDDILVFSRDFEKHLRDLEEVFDRLREADILLKASKCKFAMKEVAYLGHVVAEEGIRPDPSKIAKLKSFPAPTSVGEVRTFLGLAGYYRKFIEKFSLKAAPLYDLTQKDATFEWTQAHEDAKKQIIEDIANNAVLAHPRFDLPFILDTDASDVGLSGVLSQVVEGVERPIAFASRRIQPAERAWHIREKEALAIIWSLETFRHFLIGSRFSVRTDHKPLRVLKEANKGRLERWALRLAEFGDFEIIHRDGSKHSNADAFTRVFAEADGLPDNAFVGIVAESRMKVPDIAEIQAAQHADGEYDTLWMKAASSKTPLQLHDDVLGIRAPDGSFRPFLPSALLERTVRAIHCSPDGGHFGAERTAATLRKLFTLPNAERRVREVLRGCLPCLRRKVPLQRPGKLGSTPPVRPWHTVAMDFCGPYSVASSGNIYVLVFIDHFTKWVELAPLPDAKTETVCKALQNKVVFRHGCPERLLSDNGPQFRSLLLQEVCDVFGIDKIFSSPYYPQGDGNAERFMRTLNNALGILAHDNVDEWDRYLPAIAYAFNTTPSAATGYTPFYLNHGREVSPTQLRELEEWGRPRDQGNYVERLRATVSKARAGAEAHLRREWEGVKRRFDKRKDITLEEGDTVLIRLNEHEVAVESKCRKLSYKWSEPATIVRAMKNGRTYELRRSDGRLETINVARLLPLKEELWRVDGEDVKAMEPNRKVVWQGDASDSDEDFEVAVAPGSTPTATEEEMIASPKNEQSSLVVGQNNVYEVVRIMAQRSGKDHVGRPETFYKIRWKGFRPADDTWEPARNVNQAALDEWQSRQRGRKRG